MKPSLTLQTKTIKGPTTMKPTLALLTALLLAPEAARADLVAHFRFDDDLAHPFTFISV
jgi:hypothetical protein